jgi:glucosamine--fructose-6-phosphate aminotransferase (isomerizing)
VGLIDEIREQPEVVARLVESGRPVAEQVAAEARRRDVQFAVLAARGSSDHAAIYAQYVLAVRNGLTAALAAPSAISLFGGRPRMDHALVVGISQSGRSPDIVGVVAEAARQGALTLAITNDPSSPLAAVAGHVLDLAAGEERAVAATKTYTAELAAVAVLSEALRGADGAELAGLPGAIGSALRSEEAAAEAAADLASLDRCLVLGRGFDYATSREWALKLQELARVVAHGFSGADVAHGPIILAAPDVPVLAIVSSGAAEHALDPVLARAVGAGAPLVVVGDSDRRDLPPAYRLPTPAGVPDWLHPIASIVPCQLFAYHLAVAKGLATDQIAGLDKVTLTR